jgi:hypothetical protein
MGLSNAGIVRVAHTWRGLPCVLRESQTSQKPRYLRHPGLIKLKWGRANGEMVRW